MMRRKERYKQVKPPKMGAFAFVAGYIDTETGDLVGLKRLKKETRSNSEAIHRLEREIALLKTLAPHPNIVPLLDKETEEEDPWYVMPYADCNLGELLEKLNNQLIVKDRIQIFDGILAAMVHAHQLSILHRDIAPTNVLVYFQEDSTYTVKVADFGLGRDITSDSAHTKSAQSSYGHFYYTAPEQLKRLKDATVKSDIYSLGKLLNFVMTGRIPQSYQQCDFGTVIKKATESEPENRYQTIVEFEEAYEEIKAFLNRSYEAPPEERLQEYASKSVEIDWLDFHHCAVLGESDTHVYNDYMSPVIQVLDSAEAVSEYYKVVDAEILEFVRTYIRNMAECNSTLGWPFDAANNFCRPIEWIYRAVTTPDVRIECFKGLWELAYRSDRWSAQRVIRRILADGSLPEGSDVEIAQIIATSKARLTQDQVKELSSPTVPRIIRQTLRDSIAA